MKSQLLVKNNISNIMEIIKPKTETRNFKYFVLRNNIKCILINDNNLEKSYIVANVNIGSFANKYYYEGMAHLLEHMCFISNNKHHEINYLSKKVTESGGNTNAFTNELTTIYYLDIFTKNIEELLDIFVNCLLNAELKEEYISKEINNVDAEHKKNINSDSWKLLEIERLLANSNNNYNGFFCGNKNTLNKKDIHQKMINFYKEFYNSNNITFCIGSNLKIDDQYKLLYYALNKIPKSKIINPIKLNKPIYNNNYGKTFYVKTHNEKILKYIFECPPFDKKNILFKLLSNVLNSFENNLPIYYLKLKGLIQSLHSYYNSYGLFIININLSDFGFNNITLIDNFIQYSIKIILNFDWEKVYKYYKIIDDFEFDNLTKPETLDLCIQLTENLLYYKPNEIYKSSSIYYEFNKKHIAVLKKIFCFDKCIRIISNKEFKYSKYKTDPNYGTKYVEIPFKYKQITFNEKICFDFNNKYNKTKAIIYNNLTTNIPIQIKNNIWFGNTSLFNEPFVNCNIIFYNKKYFNTPLNTILSDLSINILNEYIINNLYKAAQFNFTSFLSSAPKSNAITLNFDMVNDIKVIQKYIDQVFNIINNPIELTEDYIKQKINNYLDNLNSIEFTNPWEFTNYIFKSYFDNFYIYTEQLKILPTITLKQVKHYINNLFTKTTNQIFIYGNIKNIPTFNLDLKSSKNKFPKINIQDIRIKHPNSLEKSNCIKISYFTGSFIPLKNLHLIFVGLITQSMFFKELRTEKLLGYMVKMIYGKIENNYYIYQQIQSEKPCEEIINHINEFNKTLINKIKQVDLTIWTDTVTKLLSKKDIFLNDAISKYYSEVLQQTFVFNRNELLLSNINKVSKESIIDFINKYIINNKNKSIIQVYTKSTK